MRTEYGVLVAVWKFPRDLNRIEFYDSDAMRGEELPVGHYPLTMDQGAWGEYMSDAQLERTPVSEGVTYKGHQEEVGSHLSACTNFRE